MRSITVSMDVFARIWALREDGEGDEDRILRRLLEVKTSLLASPSGPVGQPVKPNASGYADARFGVAFPEGQEISRTYKGQEFVARATEGALHLLNTGQRYRSLNELSRAIGAKTENAWQNWFHIDSEGNRMPVSKLRDPQKIRQRLPSATNAASSGQAPTDNIAPSVIGDSDGTWRDDVRLALTRLGGRAHLSKIYDETERVRREFGRGVPPSHEATIRRTLEDHSSDSDNYRGGADLFCMPEGRGAGVWALRQS